MSIRSDARAHLTNAGGWWVRDPATMTDFCGEPTADGDSEAMYLREWYEANREAWWQRSRWGFLVIFIGGPMPRLPLDSGVADDFMLILGQQVDIIAAQRAKYARPTELAK